MNTRKTTKEHDHIFSKIDRFVYNFVIAVKNISPRKVGRAPAKVYHFFCHVLAAKRYFPGRTYWFWLGWLHRKFKPANYVEIGVARGGSLKLARCLSVGIDPAIRESKLQESRVKLFKQTSDDFFAQHDLCEVLGAEFVEMAFIDGLHTFDQALKDFINLEGYSRPGSVIAFHDTFPVTPLTASRDRKSYFWLGDTWKVVMILKAMRPDLKVCTLPAFPSGLTLVTGLDRNSRLLSHEFAQITDRWMDADLESYLPEMKIHLNVIDNDIEAVSRFLEMNSAI